MSRKTNIRGFLKESGRSISGKVRKTDESKMEREERRKVRIAKKEMKLREAEREEKTKERRNFKS